jgi:DNA-binding transcriptional MerR regulator
MAEDGIFPNLDDETVTKADSAEALSDLIDQEVNARLDEVQQRVAKALKNGVEPTEIRSYENALHFLNGVKDADLNDETEKGENLRYQIIMQDFLNKGYSKERADKLTRRSIDAGTDLDDAKEALQSNKEHFQKKYQDLLDEAEEKANAEKEKTRRQSEQLKNSLLKDKNLLGDMEISQEVRKKAFEVISRPIYKDPETGEYLTAVQRYEQEHPVEFIKYVGLVMAMTDNFKDFKSFYKGEVKKAERKGMRALEQTINGTRRNTDGSLRMVTRAKDDPESVIPSGFKLAL